jgi:hypothetical protein
VIHCASSGAPTRYAIGRKRLDVTAITPVRSKTEALPRSRALVGSTTSSARPLGRCARTEDVRMLASAAATTASAAKTTNAVRSPAVPRASGVHSKIFCHTRESALTEMTRGWVRLASR